MEHKRWIGRHGNWERSNESVDGYPSRNERNKTDTLDLDDLINWLEYAHTGYHAARRTIEQEEHWARLLRDMLCESLVKSLIFWGEYRFGFQCKECYTINRGFINVAESNKSTIVMTEKCDCLKSRKSDMEYYILNKFEELK